jgi:hypothetical protein
VCLEPQEASGVTIAGHLADVGGRTYVRGMTALMDLHPDAGHPAVEVTARVHELLDGLDVSDPLPSGEYADVIGAWERLARRVDAVRLELVAAADRSDVALDSAHASTAAWLAATTHGDTGDAARDVGLARGLGQPGHPSPTRAALAAGSISKAHAAIIVSTLDRLPDHLDQEQRDLIEAWLLRQAHSLSPRRLCRAARRALEEVEPDPDVVDDAEDDQLDKEERAQLARTRLTLHDNPDGTVSGHFVVPKVAGAILRTVIDAMTSPRRGARGASEAQAGPSGSRIDWAHHRGLALVELLEHLPTDHLPHKVAATLVITLDEGWLTGKLKAAGLVTDDVISPGEARRLACGAGILPAVLDGRSVAVDLGRSARLFTETQRVAGALSHTSCAADGCERAYAWCELHHRHPWGLGGPTDLDNMVPLCGFHHRRVHDRGYDHRWRPDGSVTFHRRT